MRYLRIVIVVPPFYVGTSGINLVTFFGTNRPMDSGALEVWLKLTFLSKWGAALKAAMDVWRGRKSGFTR